MAQSVIKTEQGRGLRNDWHMLVGRTVEVWCLGEHILTGRVDQAANDDAVLWIAADGSRTRKLFDKRSGYQMWA
jgi:hypothetical protein